jgi:hypothetical protein
MVVQHVCNVPQVIMPRKVAAQLVIYARLAHILYLVVQPVLNVTQVIIPGQMAVHLVMNVWKIHTQTQQALRHVLAVLQVHSNQHGPARNAKNMN